MLVYRKNQAGWNDLVGNMPPGLRLPSGVWQLAINDDASVISYMDANNRVGHIAISGDDHQALRQALVGNAPVMVN